MQAVHIQTDDLNPDYQAGFVELFIRFIDGVKDVAAIPSLHLVSVLYDERQADPTKIIRALRAAGVHARRYRPERKRTRAASRIGALG